MSLRWTPWTRALQDSLIYPQTTTRGLCWICKCDGAERFTGFGGLPFSESTSDGKYALYLVSIAGWWAHLPDEEGQPTGRQFGRSAVFICVPEDLAIGYGRVRWTGHRSLFRIWIWRRGKPRLFLIWGDTTPTRSRPRCFDMVTRSSSCKHGLLAMFTSGSSRIIQQSDPGHQASYLAISNPGYDRPHVRCCNLAGTEQSGEEAIWRRCARPLQFLVPWNLERRGLQLATG